MNAGAERGVNYEHMQALCDTYIPKTAFDVARLAVVSKILTLTRVHGHVAEALLCRDAGTLELGMLLKVRDGTSGIQGAVAKVAWKPQCCGGRVAHYVLWKV